MIMPFSIGIFLAAIGFYYFYKNHFKKAKILLTISFTWIVLIAYAPFHQIMKNQLVFQYKYLENIPKDVKYILLLGGDIDKRGWEALRLYNKIPNAKIITSGAGIEAKKNANILIQSGVLKKDIIMHTTPKDTVEEAIIMKKNFNEKSFFLVTAPHHMPRAMAVFIKAGCNPIAAPTKIYDDKKLNFSFFPRGVFIAPTEVMWHEYLGLVWSKLRGHI